MKKFLFITVLIPLGFFFAEIVSAQNWASVKENFRNIRSVKAEFSQKRYAKILTKPLLSEGRLFFSAPDSLRWEYLHPLRTVMLQKGTTVQVFNFFEGQWKPEMTEAAGATGTIVAEIRQWFQGRFDESTLFKQAYSPGPPARVIMVPGEGINKFIHRIEIILSAKPGVIDRVDIEESGNSRTSIEFRNVKINSNFPSEVFEKP